MIMKKHASISIIIAVMTLCFVARANAQLIAQSNEKLYLPNFGQVKEYPQSIETAAYFYDSADVLQWLLNHGFRSKSGNVITFRDNSYYFQYYNGDWKGSLNSVVNIKSNSATVIIDSYDSYRTYIYCQPAKRRIGVKLYGKKGIGYYNMVW